jgi:aspartate/methionine/tyrosine aminotransferase
MLRISRKAETFTESVIREMNRLAVAAGAVGLAQGFPDFACPPELKAAAAEAVAADIHQYAITFGSQPLRDAIVAKTARFHPEWRIDPDTDITVVNGATEGMMTSRGPSIWARSRSSVHSSRPSSPEAFAETWFS